MQIIAKLFGRQTGSEGFDARIGQAVCFIAGLLIFIIGIFKLTRLELTETAAFLGVMLTLAVALLCVILGVLVYIAQNIKNIEKEEPIEGETGKVDVETKSI